MRDSYLHARREQVRRTDNEPLPSPDGRGVGGEGLLWFQQIRKRVI
jgi:hypothetical protein